jgi:hypothetical protein
MTNKIGEMQDVFPFIVCQESRRIVSQHIPFFDNDFKRKLYEHYTEVLLIVNKFNVLLLPVLLLTETLCILKSKFCYIYHNQIT